MDITVHGQANAPVSNVAINAIAIFLSFRISLIYWVYEQRERWVCVHQNYRRELRSLIQHFSYRTISAASSPLQFKPVPFLIHAALQIWREFTWAENGRLKVKSLCSCKNHLPWLWERGSERVVVRACFSWELVCVIAVISCGIECEWCSALPLIQCKTQLNRLKLSELY